MKQFFVVMAVYVDSANFKDYARYAVQADSAQEAESFVSSFLRQRMYRVVNCQTFSFEEFMSESGGLVKI